MKLVKSSVRKSLTHNIHQIITKRLLFHQIRLIIRGLQITARRLYNIAQVIISLPAGPCGCLSNIPGRAGANNRLRTPFLRTNGVIDGGRQNFQRLHDSLWYETVTLARVLSKPLPDRNILPSPQTVAEQGVMQGVRLKPFGQSSHAHQSLILIAGQLTSEPGQKGNPPVHSRIASKVRQFAPDPRNTIKSP